MRKDEAGDKSHDEQTERMDRPAFHFSSFHRWSHMFSTMHISLLKYNIAYLYLFSKAVSLLHCSVLTLSNIAAVPQGLSVNHKYLLNTQYVVMIRPSI